MQVLFLKNAFFCTNFRKVCTKKAQGVYNRLLTIVLVRRHRLSCSGKGILFVCGTTSGLRSQFRNSFTHSYREVWKNCHRKGRGVLFPTIVGSSIMKSPNGHNYRKRDQLFKTRATIVDMVILQSSVKIDFTRQICLKKKEKKLSNVALKFSASVVSAFRSAILRRMFFSVTVKFQYAGGFSLQKSFGILFPKIVLWQNSSIRLGLE